MSAVAGPWPGRGQALSRHRALQSAKRTPAVSLGEPGEPGGARRWWPRGVRALAGLQRGALRPPLPPPARGGLPPTPVPEGRGLPFVRRQWGGGRVQAGPAGPARPCRGPRGSQPMRVVGGLSLSLSLLCCSAALAFYLYPHLPPPLPLGHAQSVLYVSMFIE